MQWLAQQLSQDLPTKKVSEIVARMSGVSKKAIYRWLIDIAK